MKTYYLYKHTFPNNKVYIGITNQQPERRWRNGKGYLLKNKTTNAYTQPLIANAILKYGWENVKHEILFETVNKKEIEEKERYYITTVYHSNNEKFGYNISNGGNYYGLFSIKTRKLMSLKKKGKPSLNKGKHFSEKARKNMSLAHIGNKPSKETIEKRKQTLKGFKHSEESKQKMRLKAIGNKNALGCKRSKEFIENLRSFKLGTKHSINTKKKISETKHKQKWWNNGKIQTTCETCPGKDFIRGMLKNGRITKRN